MANTDLTQGHRALRPRARILRTFGEELISSETVAIIELVKNAYDADAGSVLIRFENSLEENEGVLCVEDDGHGMPLQVVERSWMEPATDEKKKAKTSQFLARRLLGEKGVGRFAAARLASELELSTRAVLSSTEVYAYFDWSQFDKDNLYLDEVLIFAEEREPKDFLPSRPLPPSMDSKNSALPRDGSHGTLLRMNKLKRTWSFKELEELRRGLSRLISPFEEDRDFRIFLQLPDQSANNAQELEPPEIINFPHYTLDGSITSNGAFTLDVKLHAVGESHPITGWFLRSASSPQTLTKSENPPSFENGERGIRCGALSFHILVWDRDQLDNIEQKLGTGIRSIRKDLDSVAGISIYRDGFRVLPYGEPENDWLKLDLRRVQNPTLRLSNNQITGYIKISADTNPQLKDQSNREGLDNNQAYSDLQGVMKLALAELETLRFKEKKNRSKPSDRSEPQSLLKPPDTTTLREQISALQQSEKTLELFDRTTKAWESQIVRIREVLSRYHTLATLGQLVDKVVHDGRQPLSTIQGQAALAHETLAKALSRPDIDPAFHSLGTDIDQRLGRIKDAAGLIDLLLKRIEPLGGRKKGRPSKVYLNEIIRSAFDHFEQELREQGIQVTLPVMDDLVQVDALELQEVLINLLSNSLFWLSQVPRGRRSILVECSRPRPHEVDILFADSGPGIPRANRSAIFEPYFSTKPDGVGLGLVIAGEIVRDYYDGGLELLDSGPLPGAVFRIKLRKRV